MSGPTSTARRTWSSASQPRRSRSMQSGLSYQRIPPDYRFPYGHTHKEQEELYVVVRGSGRMKLDDEIVEVKEWDVVRVRPARGEATRAGRRASRSSSSARPISARIRAETWRVSATGWAGPAPRACASGARQDRRKPEVAEDTRCRRTR